MQSMRSRVYAFNGKGQFIATIRDFKTHRVLLLPGGGQDPGESIEACARREAAEEVGITLGDLVPLTTILQSVKPGDKEHHYYKTREVVYLTLPFFKAPVFGDRFVLKEPEKFAAADWIYPKDLVEYAARHNAEIGYGIQQTISLVS